MKAVTQWWYKFFGHCSKQTKRKLYTITHIPVSFCCCCRCYDYKISFYRFLQKEVKSILYFLRSSHSWRIDIFLNICYICFAYFLCVFVQFIFPQHNHIGMRANEIERKYTKWCKRKLCK